MIPYISPKKGRFFRVRSCRLRGRFLYYKCLRETNGITFLMTPWQTLAIIPRGCSTCRAPWRVPPSQDPDEHGTAKACPRMTIYQIAVSFFRFFGLAFRSCIDKTVFLNGRTITRCEPTLPPRGLAFAYGSSPCGAGRSHPGSQARPSSSGLWAVGS